MKVVEYHDREPAFVRRYAALAGIADDALLDYADEVEYVDAGERVMMWRTRIPADVDGRAAGAAGDARFVVADGRGRGDAGEAAAAVKLTRKVVPDADKYGHGESVRARIGRDGPAKWKVDVLADRYECGMNDPGHDSYSGMTLPEALAVAKAWLGMFSGGGWRD